MTSLVRSIILTAILTACTAVAVQAQNDPAVKIPATAPIGVGAILNTVLFSQPFCDGQMDALGKKVERGIYVLGGPSTPLISLPTPSPCAENYAALSFGEGGFTAGDLFVFDLSQGVNKGRILKSSGLGPFSVFSDTPAFLGDHVGPNFDRVGTFGFKLIVTGDFGVRGLNPDGSIAFVIPSPDPSSKLENSRVAPLSFKPCPGCLFLVTSPDNPPTPGKIFVVKPGTTTPVFFATGPASPETVLFPEANPCTTKIQGKNIEYFQAGFTQLPLKDGMFSLPPFGAILGWTDAQLKPFIGDFLVPDEFTGIVWAYNGPDKNGQPDRVKFSTTGYNLEGATLSTCICPNPKSQCNSGLSSAGGKDECDDSKDSKDSEDRKSKP